MLIFLVLTFDTVNFVAEPILPEVSSVNGLYDCRRRLEYFWRDVPCSNVYSDAAYPDGAAGKIVFYGLVRTVHGTFHFML